MSDLLGAQEDLVRRFRAEFLPTPLDATVAVAVHSLGSGAPLHGLRQAPHGDACGWFIWAGDPSTAEDFFEHLQAGQLADLVPQVLPYLGLGPGWRFLLAQGYEDVWFDHDLLGA